MRRSRGDFLFLGAVLGVLLGGCLLTLRVCAGTIYTSPYVSLSPDGKAFTTNGGDQNIQQYSYGTILSTGIQSVTKTLAAGQHYFMYARVKNVPIGYWKVEHSNGICCHSAYPKEGASFHGVGFTRSACFQQYFSGWMAYCADCGERLTPMLIYMSARTAGTISSLDMDMAYYYLCPFCRNLEQGRQLPAHYCKMISWNRYQVQYRSNANSGVSGSMESTIHMYNNGSTYEGETVNVEKQLRKNAYIRDGYVFLGWNTMADGSGQSFSDQQEIYNLTQENYDGSGRGVVVLYAQWAKQESTLRIDPAGGSYQGHREVSQIRQTYGSSYMVNADALKAPEGYTIIFDTQGGSLVEPVKSRVTFDQWVLSVPFYGKFWNSVYYFEGNAGVTDTITASYLREAIFLPGPERPGYLFEGWYYDAGGTSFAGTEGDPLLPDRDLVLYAKWTDQFGLKADVKRILEPHDPIFRCGESGVLSFTVFGYADRVEVQLPEELTSKDSRVHTGFQYHGIGLEHTEEVEFMVPLYTPMGEYEIIVTAYKGEKVLTEIPLIWTLGESVSVLDDIRTRLR